MRRVVTGRSPSPSPRVRPVRVLRGARDEGVTLAVGSGDRAAVERGTAVLSPAEAREVAAALVDAAAEAEDG
jgi:hypothetical protein